MALARDLSDLPTPAALTGDGRVPDPEPTFLRPYFDAIRERTGMTQSDLARASGVSQGRISEFEAGRLNVRPATVKALSEALAVPMTALMVNPDAATV